MNQNFHHPSPCASHSKRVLSAFTLVEILISILILALGVLGLGALFPVIIREQRLGTDATAGVSVSNSARAMLTQSEWGAGLGTLDGTVHPILSNGNRAAGTQFLWNVLRNPNYLSKMHAGDLVQKGLGKGYQFNSTTGISTTFQFYGQGEWYTSVVDPMTGTLQLGYPEVNNAALSISGVGTVYYSDTAICKGSVNVPVAARLYPSGQEPQFVWDVAFQRVTDFEHTHNPILDAVRAVVFVRRLDPRLRISGAATSIRDAITNGSLLVQPADRKFPVSEIIATGDPALDGSTQPTSQYQYSGIKTCEIEFQFDTSPTAPQLNHRDRLYQPQQWVYGQPVNLPRVWAQMKQPGQKLVDNLGNVYTVVGSGTEPGVGSGEYLKVDPPIPESVTKERAAPLAAETTAYPPGDYSKRAIRQVAFTPQIPVSVTLVEVARGSGQ